MVKYGMFASALVLAALLGHLLTERSYDLEEVQNNESAEIQAAPASNLGFNSGSERINSFERDSSLERNSSPELSKNSESKKTEQAKPAAIKNSVAIQLDPITAIQAVKLKASQAAAKAPGIQPPELAPNENVAAGSKKNPVVSEGAAALDEAVSRRTEVAGVPHTENVSTDSAFQTSVNPNPVGDMLAILSPLLKLDGTPLGLDNIKGKTLLLALWASWCGPCRQQLPNFDELAKKLNNPELAVIVLAMDENIEEIRGAMAYWPINYPIAILDPSTAERLQINAMPTTLIVNSQGRLRVRIVGDLNNPALYEQKLLGVLAETKTNSQKPSTIMKLAGGDLAAQ